MSTQQILLALYFAANALASVALVGKKRPPITAGGAAISVIIYGLLIWAVVAA